MPVQWFTLRTIAPFPAVTFDGNNFDEVVKFAQAFVGPGRMTVRDGALIAHLKDHEQVVQPGWSVSARHGGLIVTAALIRDDEWDPVDAPR